MLGATSRKDGYMAVSYTHLDVYKRQPTSMSGSITGITSRLPVTSFPSAVKPVSYTHLLVFFHSTHDLHQLKKACFQQRSNATSSMPVSYTHLRKAQTPHGKQSVRKLMGHGGDINAIEVDTPKLFDKVARKWGVDYAIRRVVDEKYLLLFKARQADAITGCFAEYSRLELKRAKSRQPPIREQLRQAEDCLLYTSRCV